MKKKTRRKRDPMFVEDVAHEAGVALDTVRYWIHMGKLKSTKPGRRRLIKRSTFERFMRT